MAVQISGTTVINDSRKALLQSINVGQYSSNPGSPSTGDIYYNTSSNDLRYYNGSSWQVISS